jgi:hypothetical protein
MRTGEVNAAIRRHYKTGEYAVMFEVGNTTGGGVRRHADAVVMNLWPSRGLLIEGIEVKVSRSDWRREIENPAKAEEIAQYCDRWWVITPDGIVQDHELPFNWGHMICNDQGVLRIKKAAPKLEAIPPTRGFVAAMLRRASDQDSVMIDRMVNQKMVVERASIEKEIERRVAQKTASADRIADKLAKLKAIGIDLEYAYEGAEEFAEAYNLGRRLRQTYSLTGLKHTADNLERAVKVIREVDLALNGTDVISAELRVQ